MTKKVLTVTEDTPIEEAARIMADNKIGGLPVVRDEKVVGIITETDLFKMFLELMGARESGIRATVLVLDEPGQLAKLTGAIAGKGGNIIAFTQFSGKDPSNRQVTLKVTGVTEEQVKTEIEPLVVRILDIRTTS
jgi:acetoin utilization protein AcuB